MTANLNLPATIIWQERSLRLLDQRVLPHEVTYLTIKDLDAACVAIKTLAVRGAPAIGIAAGYALADSMQQVPQTDFLSVLEHNGNTLKAARPTAVNLAWAVNRLTARAAVEPSYAALCDEAEQIHAEDRRLCKQIGEHGAALIEEGCGVLTHCNAGSLAVSELGTATAPMYLAHQAGRRFKVYADETRPLLQGARLTAWELDRAGIDVTLLCDNMAASLMAERKVDLVIVGTDRVARNGDVANKIGTLGLAILARHYDIPFYVACPSSTYDPHTANGAAIEIEQRSGDEVRGSAAANVPAYSPAFDVTPADLVSGLITDRGLVLEPDETRLVELLVGPSN